MKTTCLIVDDEPLARDLVRNHLEKLDNFEVAAECCNAMKALQALQKFDIDIMFMDIRMPQISGIDFLKTLNNPPKVIVTSAHPEYAVNGFELDVVDFLLKPITFERFLKAVNKYYELIEREIPVSAEKTKHAINPDEFIYVKENKKTVKIYLREILYIEGLSEYVQIYTENKKLITKASMTNMEEKLPSLSFMRIHKSYIVSLTKIEAFTSTSIELPGKELPIGRSYKNSVHKMLNAAGAATSV